MLDKFKSEAGYLLIVNRKILHFREMEDLVIRRDSWDAFFYGDVFLPALP